MSNLKKQGLRALIWDLVGKLSSQGVSFIVTIVLARLLDPSDFGLIAMIMVVVGMAQVFTDIGLGGALIQKNDVSQTHYSSVFFFNLSVASLLSLLMFIFAENIATFYNLEQLLTLIKVVCVIFIFNALGSVQIARLRKQLNYALIAKAGVISSVFSGFVGIAMATYEFGVWSLVAQILSQSLLNSMLLWLFSRWRPAYSFSIQSLKELWTFGFRMFLSGLLDAIYSRLDYLIIGKIFPPVTLGYFQRAKQFNSLIIQYTSGSLMSVLFPVLSQIKNNLPRFQVVILNALHVLSFVTFLLLGGLYLLAEEVVLFLFTEKWLPTVHYMKLLLLSGFGYPLGALLVNILSSRGNSKAFLKLELIKKAVHTINFINAIYFGLNSYLYGLVITTIIGISLNVTFAAREIQLPSLSFFKPIIVQMAVCCVGVTATLFVNDFVAKGYLIAFFLKGFTFFILFLGLNFIFRTKSYEVICEKVSTIIIRN
ncbi:lipopolysaccharide biosynthesis protein [Alteromonas sp. Cnat3-28]|uniref:lipopolysaccharide biosynthesis protein n=1 Tax=Alteromonas sp. Cnat3-28 TaxID=2917729 RepID=UPI001EF7088E|nr:lipopolysaccharide biosynthesis protein [Alteromonas sp. Cnat3-28]MCG7644904.1 lipopolysaccharide biosynthesis protein [Alteromonas sp. Cnat3-28]